MKKLTLAVGLASALIAGESHAAVFTSTINQTIAGGGQVNFHTLYRRADDNNILTGVSQVGDVAAGTSAVTIAADTTADTARYNSMSLIAPSVISHTSTGNTVPINYPLVVVPANFPNPPVIQQVTGDYFTKVVLNSITSSTAPTLVSSSATPLVFAGSEFFADVNITLGASSFTLNGVFEAHGPTTTETQSFSIVYNINSRFKQARSAIPGGPGFGDGFPFSPRHLNVVYETTTSTIFDKVVDNVRFVGLPGAVFVNYFSAARVPEPSSLILAVLAAAGIRRGSGRARHGV
jgi:hypothetical protein